jgi:hypothetical protein
VASADDGLRAQRGTSSTSPADDAVDTMLAITAANSTRRSQAVAQRQHRSPRRLTPHTRVRANRVPITMVVGGHDRSEAVCADRLVTSAFARTRRSQSRTAQLPKLRTRVRFSSPALDKGAGHTACGETLSRRMHASQACAAENAHGTAVSGDGDLRLWPPLHSLRRGHGATFAPRMPHAHLAQARCHCPLRR